MAKKHTCPYCGRGFESVDRLAQHILRAHTGKNRKRDACVHAQASGG